jgi:hypothetical protein
MTRDDAHEDARRLIEQSLALAREQGALAWADRAVGTFNP